MHVMNEANGPEGGTDWQRVNWRKTERTVRNLRQRIFRATQQGDLRTLILFWCITSATSTSMPLRAQAHGWQPVEQLRDLLEPYAL